MNKTQPNMTSLYAVFGDPIEHSLSPNIHALFAQQFEIPLEYTKQRVTADEFSDSASEFFAAGGRGLNITSPLKEAAYNYADLLSDRALNAGAVNTLQYLDDDIVYGDNTDGAGLVRDLTDNLQRPITGNRILILGAGGAVQGCLAAILHQQPAAVFISNRTPSRAERLISQHEGADKTVLKVLPKSHSAALSFDLIINGTSASAHGEQPALDHRYLKDAVCYDMMYGTNAAAFVKWTTAQGAKASYDGLGMLVEQAAESFYLWHEIRPATTAVLAQLRGSATKRR